MADSASNPDSDRARAWRLVLEQRIEEIEQRIVRLEAQKTLRLRDKTPKAKPEDQRGAGS